MFIKKMDKVNVIVRQNPSIKGVLKFILLGLFVSFPATVPAQDTSQSLTYTVKPSDNLVRIAANYGSPDFWKSIFEANRDKIKDPDTIYPGQKLFIPHSVHKSQEPVDDTEKKVYEENLTQQSNKANEEDDQKTLEKFRRVFNQVVDQREEKEKKKDANPSHGLNLGGLVINETKSKMGSDFFNVFYKYWRAPENAGNFILTVTEQPIPSLGTMVTVKIDNQQVFKARLQPRFAITEELAKQAVAISYHSLRQQFSTSPQLITY